MANSSLLVIDEKNFESTINSGKVVMLDFWAEWCGPCKMFLPVVAELAEEFKDKAIIGKVNVDDNPDIAEKFGIMSIPTVILFKDGEIIDKFTGARPKPLMINMLNKYLGE